MKRLLTIALVLSFVLISFLAVVKADGITSLNGTHIITECVYNGTLGSCGTPINSSFLVTGCREITSPGTYVLQNGLNVGTSLTCLNVHDTSNVYIDCANNAISFDGSIFGNGAVNISNVNGFSLKNCIIKANNVHINNIGLGIRVINSPNGIISGNNFTGSLFDVRGSSNLQVTENNFSKSAYQQSGGSNNNLIKENSFDAETGSATLISILSSDGSGNTIENNFVEGHGTGVTVGIHNGSDDGIVIANESGDLVSGNTLQDFWGCGIENTGLIKDTTISNNNIKNALYCGIGGWYWSSLQGNTYSGNHVDSSGTLFTFYRLYALNPGEDFVYFTDNTFTGNVLTNVLNTRGYATDIDMSQNMYGEVDSSKFVAYNDTFSNNDFGPGYGPYILPRSMVVDGGGNRCGPTSLQQNASPLDCGNSSSASVFSSVHPSKINSSNSSSNAPEENFQNVSPSGGKGIPVIGSICSGCSESGTCYPLGYIKNGTYCSSNLSFVLQYSSGSSCNNGFECGSNLCVSSQCISQSLLQRFLDWIKALFG